MCIHFSVRTGEPQEWKLENTIALNISCQGWKTMEHPETSLICQPMGLLDFRPITWDHDGATWLQPISLQVKWPLLEVKFMSLDNAGVMWGQPLSLWSHLRSNWLVGTLLGLPEFNLLACGGYLRSNSWLGTMLVHAELCEEASQNPRPVVSVSLTCVHETLFMPINFLPLCSAETAPWTLGSPTHEGHWLVGVQQSIPPALRSLSAGAVTQGISPLTQIC